MQRAIGSILGLLDEATALEGPGESSRLVVPVLALPGSSPRPAAFPPHKAARVLHQARYRDLPTHPLPCGCPSKLQPLSGHRAPVDQAGLGSTASAVAARAFLGLLAVGAATGTATGDGAGLVLVLVLVLALPTATESVQPPIHAKTTSSSSKPPLSFFSLLASRIAVGNPDILGEAASRWRLASFDTIRACLASPRSQSPNAAQAPGRNEVAIRSLSAP